MSTLGKHYNVCPKTQKMVKNSSLCTVTSSITKPQQP